MAKLAMDRLVRAGNTAAVAGIAAILLVGFVLQLALGELPCPLCNLQRVAFVLAGFGFLMNVVLGSQPIHYGLALLGALFGLVASGRQVLLHIVPGTGAYGEAILGLHYYSWALVLFLAIIAGTAAILVLAGSGRRDGAPPTLLGVEKLAVGALVALTFANALATFVQCGPIECPDDPTGYWLLGG